MTTKNMAQRLARLEARRQPPLEIVVCWCPDNEPHRPDCEAARFGDDAHVIHLRWDDDDD